MKEVNQILIKVRSTDNIELKAIFEKLDLYIKAYISIKNPAPISEPSDKIKDLHIQLDETTSQRNEYKSQIDDLKSQLQAALSSKEDKDKEILKLLEERTYEGKIKEDLSI